jgi:hypothetical protein
MDLYGQQHLALQKAFDTERLANAVKSNTVVFSKYGGPPWLSNLFLQRR